MYIATTIKTIQHGLAAVLMVLVAFGVSIPASANSSHSCPKMDTMVDHDMCDMDEDCCDRMSAINCPDDMDCDCGCDHAYMSSTFFVSPTGFISPLFRAQTSMPQNMRARVYVISMDAPPPRG